MVSNDFRLLKEIKFHLGEILLLKRQIKEEESRITVIQKQIDGKEVQLEDLLAQQKGIHSVIASKEKELFELEKKLETSQSHSNMAHNQKEAEALEHEQSTLGKSVEELQENLLNLMDEEETASTDISKVNTFLEGSRQSLKEISEEVESKRSEYQTQIDDHDKEWKEHARALGDANKTIFKNGYNKFKETTPFAELNGQSCKRCGYGLDSTLHRSVLAQTALEICPGCNRIFLI
jgi:predicted  nucleic acid-binding Zn-ribbon protein